MAPCFPGRSTGEPKHSPESCPAAWKAKKGGENTQSQSHSNAIPCKSSASQKVEPGHPFQRNGTEPACRGLE